MKDILLQEEQRRFLVRGKRLDNGEWIQGYYFQIWEQAFILWGTTNGIPNMIEIDPSSVEENQCRLCAGSENWNG